MVFIPKQHVVVTILVSGIFDVVFWSSWILQNL